MNKLPEICPNPSCECSLQGSPIPEDFRLKGYHGDATHYSRVIGVNIRGEYDGVLYWTCPDCGFAWPRQFGDQPAHRLNVKSTAFAMEHNQRMREEEAA